MTVAVVGQLLHGCCQSTKIVAQGTVQGVDGRTIHSESRTTCLMGDEIGNLPRLHLIGLDGRHLGLAQFVEQTSALVAAGMIHDEAQVIGRLRSHGCDEIEKVLVHLAQGVDDDDRRLCEQRSASGLGEGPDVHPSTVEFDELGIGGLPTGVADPGGDCPFPQQLFWANNQQRRPKDRSTHVFIISSGEQFSAYAARRIGAAATRRGQIRCAGRESPDTAGPRQPAG